MFRHVFIYRLKIGLRDRQMLFWTFLFPLILSTLFGMAFTNLSSGDSFATVPIAVVDNDAYQQDSALQAVLESVSQDDAASGNGATSANPGQPAAHDPLFSLRILSLADADKALADGVIAGYILPGEDLGIVVRNSGIRQTILKIFVDEYLQITSATGTIVRKNPAATSALQERLGKRLELIRNKPAGTANPDTTLVYYYALIAMACLYGGFWGLQEVESIQANQSAQAARISLVPVSKMKIFVSSLLAALSIHFLSILLLLAYLNYVLGIDFGSRIGLVLLGSFTGCMLGVTLGLLIGSLTKGGDVIKRALLIGFSMLSSYLSGLMIVNIKYIVTRSVPLISWINPANLISDAFYALYYYDTQTRFFTNIAVQLLMIVIMSAIVVLRVRRQRYASL